MDQRFFEIIDYVLGAVTSFSTLYFDALIAVLLFLLGFSLLKVGLQKMPTREGRPNFADYVRFVLPGALFGIVGLIVMVGRDPLLLVAFILTLTLVAGFAFVGVGYRLFVHGVLQYEDPKSLWDDKGLLIMRAAPSALFAIVGLIVILNALSAAPNRILAATSEYSEARQRVVEVVDERLEEAIDLLREHLDSVAIASTDP